MIFHNTNRIHIRDFSSRFRILFQMKNLRVVSMNVVDWIRIFNFNPTVDKEYFRLVVTSLRSISTKSMVRARVHKPFPRDRPELGREL